MVKDYSIYEGRIATHNNEFYGQILINTKTGLIEDVTNTKKYPSPNTIFGKDSIIFPGMGDIHIHAREDETGKQVYKEDYTTSANAALNGGVVHISAMPNTPKPLTTNLDFMGHRHRIKQINHSVSILNYVGIGVGTEPIGKPGEHMYKAYFGKSVGDLTFYDEKQLEDALIKYAGHNISFHVEYEPFIESSINGKTHSERRPIGAINHGLKLLLPLIEKYYISAKLCHWSTGMQSFDLISKHRKISEEMGLGHTTIEVSPLHLLFDTEMANKDPALWLKIQMNPAIQNREHRFALIEGLKTGFIDYLATDHAPHTLEEKHSAFIKFKENYPNSSNEEIARRMQENSPQLFKKTCCENNMSGAPWLDTYANVCIELMKKHKFTPQDIARVTSFNPGNFIKPFLNNQFENNPNLIFGKGFGQIKPEFVGSLTVLNTNKPQFITRDKLQTKVKWSPLEEMTFSGGLEAIIIRGQNMTQKFVNN